MNQPWKNPPPATNEFDLINLAGSAAFFVVGGCHPAQNTRFGVKPVIRCAVIILTGPEAGKEYVDILVFNSRVVRRLRGSTGEVVLGHIVVDATGANRAVELEDPSDYDAQAAAGWHAYYPNRLIELTKMMLDAFATEEHRQAQEAMRPSPPLTPVQRQPNPAQASSGASWGQTTQPVAPNQPPAWGQQTNTTAATPTWGQPQQPVAPSQPPTPPSAPWLTGSQNDEQPGY